MSFITWSDWEAIGVTKIVEERPKDVYAPLTLELFVYGGTDDDVANLIFKTVPTGVTMFMRGNTVVEIDNFGMKHNVRFSREVRNENDTI